MIDSSESLFMYLLQLPTLKRYQRTFREFQEQQVKIKEYHSSYTSFCDLRRGCWILHRPDFHRARLLTTVERRWGQGFQPFCIAARRKCKSDIFSLDSVYTTSDRMVPSCLTGGALCWFPKNNYVFISALIRTKWFENWALQYCRQVPRNSA